MSDSDTWQRNNEAYLKKALAWLRLRLTQKAGIRVQVETLQPSSSDQRLERRFRQQPSPQFEPVRAEWISSAVDDMTQAERVEPPPALAVLSQRFGLTPFEKKVLLLCSAMELDTRVAELCVRAQDDMNRPYPTFALALTLFNEPADEPAWNALSPTGGLRYWQLIEINQPGGIELIASRLRADERVVNYIKGLNYLDDRLIPLLSPLKITNGNGKLPPSQQAAVETILHNLEQTSKEPPPIIQLLGADAPSKELVAVHTAAIRSLQLYRLSVELLPAQSAELETFTRLWQRESMLLPVALYLDAQEVETTSSGVQATQFLRFLSRSNGLCFLSTRERQSIPGRNTLTLDINKPTATEQQEVWAIALGTAAAGIPAVLASQFNLSQAEIQEIAHTVTTTADNKHTWHKQLWDACLASTRPQLDTLAQRLEPKATWDNIVLPTEEMNLLHQIANQVKQRHTVYEDWGFHQRMNRGLGISALFAGESGTGKTMAAEVIANELCLNLYRIDLSAVVSKYIGETEKNLRRLFDAAEDGGAILFFDEADALFGKRSEVKDSHDRYANIEINYLLQRMEAFSGLAILATNMKSALDTAFMRRLRFIVNFRFPDKSERQLIWEKVFPLDTPKEALGFARLASFDLTGGSIHNIALNAAFLAAQAGTPVTMPLVLEATQAEFRKLERHVNTADFRWQTPTGALV
ncbi:ATP-binding protein [Gloeocapsopsis dulcis]|uniref:AAA family ATPase n=1 Tax=Gloeocapsopsis dulcis AAB1 = 1H9 TaxID=1433147 RepID=A0A6N8FP16_9CHRO|nr:ATP-binding protein [Gloeocapsopsis dulcis]MUL34941.1 AAA family ATPase [Gloeocapsopsis dulcis AAB1 = 1H9]WNN89987.1 ATP-binding protein [Gloeocapsopsis dulcis]